MSDILCAKCSEPWDSYGITYDIGEGDMTPAEIRLFRAGKGCPSCKFGTQCTHCDGGGIEKNGCNTCFGKGYVFTSRCLTATDPSLQQWFFGYYNSISHPIRHPNTPQRWSDELRRIWCEGDTKRKDGWVQCNTHFCPDCQAAGENCHVCGGDMRFHDQPNPIGALESLLDASDEDPIALINNFDLE